MCTTLQWSQQILLSINSWCGLIKLKSFQLHLTQLPLRNETYPFPGTFVVSEMFLAQDSIPIL